MVFRKLFLISTSVPMKWCVLSANASGRCKAGSYHSFSNEEVSVKQGALKHFAWKMCFQKCFHCFWLPEASYAEWSRTMSEIPLWFLQHPLEVLELFSLLTQSHYGTAQGKTINQFPSLPCLWNGHHEERSYMSSSN